MPEGREMLGCQKACPELSRRDGNPTYGAPAGRGDGTFTENVGLPKTRQSKLPLRFKRSDMSKPTLEKLLDILATKVDANLKREEIDVDIPLFEEGLGLDSIALMEFIACIEEEFGFQFAEEDLSLEAFSSLRNIAQTVGLKLNCALAV
jgi:acyl carrier protein